MDAIEKNLLAQVADLHEIPEGAYNIRANGKLQSRNTTANIDIVSKEDKPGIDIIIKPGTVNESVHIPVVLMESGLSDLVYNDFYIGEDCDVTIVAGCGIHNCGVDTSKHDGVHEFHIGRNSKVKYIERHYGEGDGRGENIMNPETIATLQLATRTGNYQKFKEFSKLVDDKDAPIFLRDFLDFKKNPISIDKVEPVENIVKHFVAGAMSFGALSKEAHEAICLAMNKLGARSNTGEGGEDNERFHSEIDGISLSSKTKQIASGRFGVTTEYLVNAEEIQIKWLNSSGSACSPISPLAILII